MEIVEIRERNKGKETLENIRQEIFKKSLELQSVTDKLAALNILSKSIQDEFDNNSSKILGQKKIIENLESANKDLENLKFSNESTIRSQESAIAANKQIVISQKSEIEKNIDFISEVETRQKKSSEEIDALLKRIDEERINLSSLTALVLTSKIELEKTDEKVSKLKRVEEEVKNAITSAMESFKVFELRIDQFSKDTGYIVGYDKPEDLIKNHDLQ